MDPTVVSHPRIFGRQSNRTRKFEKLEKKLGNLKQKIPYLVEYFGEVNTDLGEGLVFAAIRNFDGTVSESLNDASDSGGYDRAKLLKALKGMNQLRGDATIYNDVGENNIVVQIQKSDHESDPEYKLWVIDGIQCRALIPITEYSESYARIRKAKKIWQMKKFIVKNF